MTRCLSCIVKQTALVVVQMEQVLGFQSMFTLRPRSVRGDQDSRRQTGRTTHGLLEAFAQALASSRAGAATVIVRPPVMTRASHLNRALCSPVIVCVQGSVASRAFGSVVYEDHYHG